MKKLLGLLCALALTVTLAGCGSKEEVETIKVGASPTPHSEILEAIKPVLEEEGYKLDIVIFQDYVLPNTSLEEGQLDANFFQHQPYLDFFNESNGTHIVSLGGVHFEPMGIYAGKSASIAELPEKAKIGIPADTTNGARALKLLEANGIIKLKEGVGLEASKLDIVENPKKVEIIDMEAAILPRSLNDLNLAVINGNYAISADILDKLIVNEDKTSEAALEFTNVLAVKEGTENDPKLQALYKALTSKEAKKFLDEKYKNIFLATFE